MEQTATVKNAYKKLDSQVETFQILAGFDGFVDEIIHVVDKREDNQRFKRIDTIEAFSKRIATYSGLSGNIELVPTQIKLGGNRVGHLDTHHAFAGDGRLHPHAGGLQGEG